MQESVSNVQVFAWHMLDGVAELVQSQPEPAAGLAEQLLLWLCEPGCEFAQLIHHPHEPPEL